MASEAAAMTWSQLPDCSSLLLRLLAHLGGAPPALRSRGGAGAAPLLLSILVLSSSLCWGAEWCGLSLDQQVAQADAVVRASVVSRSRVEGGRYWATFRVDKLLHSSPGQKLPKFLRLELGTSEGGGEDCILAARVKPHGSYLVMVVGAGGQRFRLASPPIKSSKRNLRELKRILSGEEERQKVRVRRGKVQQASSKPEPRVRQTTRLSCSARGNPPPTLYWTIDGRVLENSSQTRISTKNLSKFLRKSVLKLRGSVQKSSVHLQCHAFNSYGHTSKVKMGKMRTSSPSKGSHKHQKRKSLRREAAPPSTSLRRVQEAAPSSSRRLQEGGLRGFRKATHSIQGQRGLLLPAVSPLRSSSCPIPGYCMNGGQCHFYSALGEQTCHCAKGYRGKRCERKYVSTGSLGAHMSDRFPLCLLGMAHYPCQ